MVLDPTAYGPNTTFASYPSDSKIKLYRPIGYKGVDYGGEADIKYYRHGFKVVYQSLGEFTEGSTDTEKSWVVYHHQGSGEQVIEFNSEELGAEVFYFVIQGILIHDHASIAMGGPAFGTYYSEPVNTTPEGG